MNVAARMTGAAASGEVLVTEDVVGETDAGDLTFAAAGSADLKGLAAPVELFRAARA